MNMEKLKVLFDGACIICAKEVHHYKKIDKNDQLELVDISAVDFSASDYGITENDANLHLHAIDSNGNIFVGIASFVEIWSRVPPYHYLVPVFDNKFLRPFFNTGYNVFAKYIRPKLPKRANCDDGSCSIS